MTTKTLPEVPVGMQRIYRRFERGGACTVDACQLGFWGAPASKDEEIRAKKPAHLGQAPLEQIQF